MRDEYYLKKRNLQPTAEVPYCRECNEEMELVKTNFTYKDTYRCTGCNLEIKINSDHRIIKYETAKEKITNENQSKKRKGRTGMDNHIGLTFREKNMKIERLESEIKMLKEKHHQEIQSWQKTCSILEDDILEIQEFGQREGYE